MAYTFGGWETDGTFTADTSRQFAVAKLTRYAPEPEELAELGLPYLCVTHARRQRLEPNRNAGTGIYRLGWLIEMVIALEHDADDEGAVARTIEDNLIAALMKFDRLDLAGEDTGPDGLEVVNNFESSIETEVIAGRGYSMIHLPLEVEEVQNARWRA